MSRWPSGSWTRLSRGRRFLPPAHRPNPSHHHHWFKPGRVLVRIVQLTRFLGWSGWPFKVIWGAAFARRRIRDLAHLGLRLRDDERFLVSDDWTGKGWNSGGGALVSLLGVLIRLSLWNDVGHLTSKNSTRCQRWHMWKGVGC